jgi:hypothetical protein
MDASMAPQNHAGLCPPVNFLKGAGIRIRMPILPSEKSIFFIPRVLNNDGPIGTVYFFNIQDLITFIP